MAVRTVTLKNIPITIAAANVPQRVSPFTIYTPDIELGAPSTNAGNVFFGDSSVNATDWIPIIPGEKKNYTHGTGSVGGAVQVLAFDLNKMFVVAPNAGDIVIVQYFDTEL